MLRTLFVVLLLPVALCQADEPQPRKFYKLNFVIKELDGNTVINSRNYSATTVVDGPKCSIRNSSKVPVQYSPPSKRADNIPYATTQFQNVDVSIGIDVVGVREAGGGLSMDINVSSNSISDESIQSGLPVTRLTAWSSTVLIPISKPTTVFSSDDLTTKHKMQLEPVDNFHSFIRVTNRWIKRQAKAM
jgi:hypothetical protein